jgi:undecaprenyl-diphosphatase
MSRLAICGFLVVGAIVLFIADRYGSRERDLDHVGAGRALTIGLSQAAALLPGISRSGATMSTALAFGLTRETAARFSFLLATPITLGAGLYGSRHLLTASHTSTEWVAVVVGFAAAAVSGALAIGFLLRWLRTRSMAVFSLERIVLAALVLVLLAVGH